MKAWKAEGSPLAPKDFAWATGDAAEGCNLQSAGSRRLAVCKSRDDHRTGLSGLSNGAISKKLWADYQPGPISDTS
jgi:hypothetical protein